VSLELRGGRTPFVLEKWYVDTLTPEGAVVIVYLGWLRVLGLRVARVTAELFRPDGTTVRGQAKARVVRSAEDRLEFGPATLRTDGLTWCTPALAGELRFSPRHPPVTLLDPFLEESGRRVLWTVEVPDAEVTGELRWPGGAVNIAGRGYRDRVWLDFRPWRFPIQELRWGRAVSASHATTWVTARTGDHEVAGTWTDGETCAGAAREPDLGRDRVLVEGRVADLEGLRLGALRPLLRHLSGDPHLLKRAGSATLAGEPAVAVHERVVWG
jgi:hypothetical protein